MKRDILKLHSEGSNYLIVISNKNYSKLLAIQDYPEIKYYFKNREVSEERLITELDNIGSSEKMYSEEELRKAIQLARLCTLDKQVGDFVDLSGLTEVCTYGLEETHSEDSIIEQFKKK